MITFGRLGGPGGLMMRMGGEVEGATRGNADRYLFIHVNLSADRLVLLHRCHVVRGVAHRRMHTQAHAHAQTPKHARKHAPWTRQQLAARSQAALGWAAHAALACACRQSGAGHAGDKPTTN